MAAEKAVQLIEPQSWVGVGTGSTVNFFIDALAQSGLPIKGTVSSSEASSQRLKALGVPVFPIEQVPVLDVYVDGADEIDHHGFMIKGGGALRSPEKKFLRHKPIPSFASLIKANGSRPWVSFLCP